ncbi:MAG: N-acetylmuramoyl-L-alanine amidase [Clostridiales bacterium]|nr:N-acetylmuramoyl-L-alanine amidase [Clostridiales bacterium]
MGSSANRKKSSTKKKAAASKNRKGSRARKYIMLLFLLFLVIGTTTRFGIFGDGVIVLDPGHGGSDPGAIYSGINEKDINLQVAKKTADILESAGYEVILTRKKDDFIELTDRAMISNRKNASVFVSIHCNASENPQSCGIETYNARDSQKGMELGKSIHKAVLESTGADDRGTHEKNFVVLKNTRCTAALVEIGFMSNAGELEKLTDTFYQNKVAKGIAEGIIDYIQ